MINLLDILQEAEKSMTNELRIVSGQAPMMKTINGWQALSDETLAPTFVREQILNMLDDDARVEFLQQGLICGSITIKEKFFNYVFSRSHQGINAYFSWQNQQVQLSNFALPPALLEILKKTSGVNIVTGPRQSGRSTLVQLLGKEISCDGRYSIAVFADRGEEYLQGSNEGAWQTFPVEHLSMAQNLLRGFDFVVIDSHRPQAWRYALQIAELGLRVMLVLPFAGTAIALERLSEKMEASPEIARRRLAEVVQTVLSLRLVPGIERGRQAAYELLMMTKEIRQAVIMNDWGKVEILMATLGESSGMRTLNQSLMNLMMRRKIDVKAGFAESLKPEELDQMMEKVGF